MTAAAMPRISMIPISAARWSIGAAVIALLSLASLHVLSPEFDPSWHVVSEYANGHYAWVLSLMFASWAVSTWALALAIRSQLPTTAGRIGLALLALAGLGEALASVFDINHATMHGIAGALGVLGLPVAAMLISITLSRSPRWLDGRSALLWTANLTWASLALLIVTFPLLFATFTHAGGHPSDQVPKSLPPGTIALVGWANRLLVVVYCAWAITVACQAIKVGRAIAAVR